MPLPAPRAEPGQTLLARAPGAGEEPAPERRERAPDGGAGVAEREQLRAAHGHAERAIRARALDAPTRVGPCEGGEREQLLGREVAQRGVGGAPARPPSERAERAPRTR